MQIQSWLTKQSRLLKSSLLGDSRAEITKRPLVLLVLKWGPWRLSEHLVPSTSGTEWNLSSTEDFLSLRSSQKLRIEKSIWFVPKILDGVFPVLDNFEDFLRCQIGHKLFPYIAKVDFRSGSCCARALFATLIMIVAKRIFG